MRACLISVTVAGFVSLETMLTGEPGLLVTRPLVFASSQTSLFVNAVVQPGGFIQVGVKGSESLTLRASSAGGLPPNTCVAPGGAALDSTRM
eukprot:SAG22_NODE_9522_length_585_cov_0.849794_2_plen_91_part_01